VDSDLLKKTRENTGKNAEKLSEKPKNQLKKPNIKKIILLKKKLK
jgi:hypothetical protein